VTVKVNELVPGVVAVPKSFPSEVFSERPAGNAPALIEYVRGDNPPETVHPFWYAAPVTAAGSAHDKVRVGGETIKLSSGTRAVCAGEPLSVTWTTNENVPAYFGVPVIAPVDEFMLKPSIVVRSVSVVIE